MKIVIPGGTGQVGTILARAFQADGHEVVLLSRRMEQSAWRVLRWDAETLGDWASEFENADAVINLAGRSVNCRYTPENRRQIIESRVKSTRVVGEAISKATNPPRVWLQASTATIYAHRFDAPNDEPASSAAMNRTRRRLGILVLTLQNLGNERLRKRTRRTHAKFQCARRW